MSAYGDAVAAVREQTGIRLELNNTGGGCMVYEGPLEGGMWVAVTEAEGFISDPEDRELAEANGERWGFLIGIYGDCQGCRVWHDKHGGEYVPHRDCNGSYGGNKAYWFFEDAVIADMAACVVEALKQLPSVGQAG